MSQLWNIKKLSSPEPVIWTISSGRCLRLTPIPTCRWRIASGEGNLSFTLWRTGGSILQSIHNFEYFIPFKATDWLPLKMLLIWISWLSSSFFHPCLFWCPFPYLLVWHPDFYIICHLYAHVNVISPPGPETDCPSRHWLPWIGAFLSPFSTFYIFALNLVFLLRPRLCCHIFLSCTTLNMFCLLF